MTSFNQRECVGCEQPCDDFYCYLCTCQQCGVNLINGICLNCTYGDGKPVTCCGCEGPLNGMFCSFCASRAGNSFSCDPNLNSFDDSENLFDYPPQPQYQTYSWELRGNDAHYGYDCPPQVLFVFVNDVVLTLTNGVDPAQIDESCTEGRPPILEKGSYMPWASRFLRFLDNKKEEGELIRNGSRNTWRLNGNQATTVRNGFAQKNEENEENLQRIPRTTPTRGKKNVQCYNYNGKGHYARDFLKHRVHDVKYFWEQMLLTIKDETRVNPNTKENDFMLMNAYGDD
uniref:Uncharacterized protein n=1 Tax=Tanacetum cinerariifolium TaxID=118510 RepID=A0A6L2P835_TANCI|nr:hypothetical protein [Tanacetum cinerariifolium]